MSIEESNKLISAFMGYEFVTVGYFDCEDETEWQRNNRDWIDKVGLESVGDYVVNVKEDIWQEFEYVKYHESWDQIMSVVEKIESSADEYTGHISINICENHCTVYRYEFKKIAKGFNQKSKIMAAYDAIVQYIQWYNTQNTSLINSKK